MNPIQGFLDTADYRSFVEVFERNAPIIRRELEEVMKIHPFSQFRHRPTGGEIVYEDGWDVFGFYERGKEYPLPPSICPRTRELIGAVPELVTAGFSKLARKSHIKPHAGKKNLIRLHLGLIVPPGCRFRVGDEVREWEENKCLVFDNTVEHEAWNDSEEDRVILLVDYVNRLGERAASHSSESPA